MANGRLDRGAKAKQKAGQKKLIEGKKVAFVNTREKSEVDRMKEELREIAEKRIEDMRKEIRGWQKKKIER